MYSFWCTLYYCSALLTYAVHYARSNDWICVFVPNTFEIAKEGKVLVPSKTRPGMVDQPDFAVGILRNVRGWVRSCSVRRFLCGFACVG